MLNKIYKKILKMLIKYHAVRIDFANEEEAEEFFKDLKS